MPNRQPLAEPADALRVRAKTLPDHAGLLEAEVTLAAVHGLSEVINRGKTTKRTCKSWPLFFGCVPGLPEPDLMCYFGPCARFPKSRPPWTRCPPSDQESLLEHLALKVGTRQPVTAESRAKRDRWLRKLDQLRARGSTGKTGVPLQEVLDDIRSER